MMSTITPQQQRFVDEYLIDLNATQAAIRAGYSEKTANRIGYQLLGKAWVSAGITEALSKRSDRTGIVADRVLQEYAKIAFSDMRSFVKWGSDGVTLKDSDELTDDDAVCVAEVSETTSEKGGSIKFKLHNKIAALDSVARHLGMFKDMAPTNVFVTKIERVIVSPPDPNGQGL